MRYKAVIFDLDGTLLDTLDDLADAANQTLRQLGYPEHPVDSYRYFVGSGLQTLVQRVLPEKKRTPENIEEAVTVFREIYSKNWKVKTKPYPGIPQMLSQLSQAGVTLCILSNKPHDFTQLCVRELLPDWDFEAVVGQRPGGPKKPDPSGALALIDQLGCKKSDIVYVGDTSIDMETAAGAGLTSVGVLWGFRTKEELQSAGADFIFASPKEIAAYVVPA